MSGDEDDALWDAVKKTVKPLRRAPPLTKTSASNVKIARTAKSKARADAVVTPVTPLARKASLLPLAPFDRRTRGRIARGNTEIEARLDLHGYKLAQAKERLFNFLDRAQARGHSLVLVITGKGTAAPKGAERGVLKREVPMWLAQSEFRSLVIGFEEAASAHGGAGALYVRVRKKR